MTDELDQLPSLPRPGSVYVSWQSRQGLGYVAKASGITSDELCDRVLADWLRAEHPSVVAHIKARFEADNDFKKKLAKELKARSNPNDLPTP